MTYWPMWSVCCGALAMVDVETAMFLRCVKCGQRCEATPTPPAAEDDAPLPSGR